MSSAHASTVAPGRWGATGAMMIVGPTKSSIDVGTGVATIDGALRTDASGHFKASGHFEVYSPGPQRADQPPVLKPARFEGVMSGQSLALTIHVGGEKAARHFTFTQGRVAKLFRPL